MLCMCCQINEDVFLSCLCFVYLHVFFSSYSAFAPVGHRTLPVYYHDLSLQTRLCWLGITCDTKRETHPPNGRKHISHPVAHKGNMSFNTETVAKRCTPFWDWTCPWSARWFINIELVSHCQTFHHSYAEEGLTSPHSIPGWEKNVLWFIGISLNQSQSPWAVLSAEQSHGAAAK